MPLTQSGIMQEGYFRASPYTRLTAVAWYRQKITVTSPNRSVGNNRSQEDQEEIISGDMPDSISAGVSMNYM